MKKNIVIVLGVIILVISLAFIFVTPQKLATGSHQNALCDYERDKEIFSKRHYFSKDDANALLGKQVRNLKCGKLKCPLRSNECLNVEIGELGKVVSIKPRAGFIDYTIIIEWNEPRYNKNSFAEQGLDDFLSYVGNDGSYEIIE